MGYIISVLLIIFCVMTLGVYAVKVIALKDLSGSFFRLDYSLIWFQGNNDYFYLLLFISFAFILDVTYNLFFDKKSRERRKEKRRLTLDEKTSFSHLASRHEIKKGLLRIEFDKKGEPVERSFRLLLDDCFNWFKKSWNKCIRWWNERKIGKPISDIHLMNEKKSWMIGGERKPIRSGVPLFTYKNRVYVDATDSHSLIIGTTNSGKTYSVIHILIELTRMAGESMIINDMKGELLQTHRGSLQNAGYNIIEINFVDPTKSDCWNLFGVIVKRWREEIIDAIKNETKINHSESKELLRDLCNTLFYDAESKDKFWNQKGADLLEGIVLLMLELSEAACIKDYNNTKTRLENLEREAERYLKAEKDVDQIIETASRLKHELEAFKAIPLEDPKINLKSAKMLVLEGNVAAKTIDGKPTNKLSQQLLKLAPSSDARLKLTDYVDAPENTKGSILSVFTSKVDMALINDNLIKMMSHQSFNMEDIGLKKTAIFLCVHDEKATYYPLVTIFIKQLYEEMIKVSRRFDNLRLPVPVNIVYDEFGISPPLKDIKSMLAAMRSRGIRMNMVIQDYSQLDENYGKELAKTIKNNVMNTVYILGGDNDTLDEISKKSGKRLVWNKERGSYDSEPVISSDRLSKMSLGEVAVFRQRRNPSITRLTAYNRYNFYKYISKLNGKEVTREPLKDIELFTLSKLPTNNKQGNLEIKKEIKEEKITKKPIDKTKELGSETLS